MFKKNKFSISKNTVTVYPFYERLLLLMFMSIFFIALAAFILFLGKTYANFSTAFFVVLLGIPTILFFIIGWILSHISVVFDVNKKIIFKKIGMIQMQSYGFEELHEIVPVTSNMQGIYYKITLAKDKYGKGIRLSSAYRSIDDKNATEFQGKVLPKIQQMLNSKVALVPLPIVPLPIKTSETHIHDFNYYNLENSVYHLKKSKKLWFLGIIVLVAAIYFNSKFSLNFSEHLPIGEYLAYAFGFLFPPIAAFMATHKLLFNCNTKMIISVYAFNSLKQEFTFADFLRFQITRNRYNGIYSDTTVSLVFNNGKILLLKAFHKTNKIQDFINETDTILKEKI